MLLLPLNCKTQGVAGSHRSGLPSLATRGGWRWSWTRPGVAEEWLRVGERPLRGLALPPGSRNKDKGSGGRSLAGSWRLGSARPSGTRWPWSLPLARLSLGKLPRGPLPTCDHETCLPCPAAPWLSPTAR